MSSKFVIFTLSFFLLAQCKSKYTLSEKVNAISTSNEMKSPSSENRVSKDGIIRIREHETVTLSDLKMNITFNSIKEDSRCPEGVQCVSQGVAVVEIQFLSVHARPRTVNLATVNIESQGYVQKELYDGYFFTLKSISPSKEKKNSKNPYVIELQVEKYRGNNLSTFPKSSRSE